MSFRIFSALIALVLTQSALAATPSVLDHGVVPDGKTLNTVALNRLVNELSAAGGGTLSFPSGRYLTGTIYLKSGVTLNLENGAVIVGSTNIADYPENQPPYPSTTLEWGRYSLIYAAGAHDVAITGQGKITGQGSDENFTKKNLLARGWTEQEAYLKRPFGLCFVGCRRVQVRNVTLENLAFWTQDYLDCDDVTIDGVRVDNQKVDYNNDGIDVDGSHDVRISNCQFITGDDGICLKSSYAVCENITVTNCVIHALCNGIKFGTASRGGFKNIAIANCAISETGLAGIALEVMDGGALDGVNVSNLVMNDVGTPIFLRLGNRGKKWLDGQKPAATGTLRNVIISNITATLAAKGGLLAASITGLPDHPIENVTISNVKIVLIPGFGRVKVDSFQLKFQSDARDNLEKKFGGDIKRLTLQDVVEKPADYPEYSMYGALPASGFFCRHVNGLSFHNVDLRFGQADNRSAIVVDDATNFEIDGLKAQAAPDGNPVILLSDVHSAVVRNSVAQDGTSTLVKVEGKSSDISLFSNDASRAKTMVALADGLMPSVVFKSGNQESGGGATAR